MPFSLCGDRFALHWSKPGLGRAPARGPVVPVRPGATVRPPERSSRGQGPEGNLYGFPVPNGRRPTATTPPGDDASEPRPQDRPWTVLPARRSADPGPDPSRMYRERGHHLPQGIGGEVDVLLLAVVADLIGSEVAALRIVEPSSMPAGVRSNSMAQSKTGRGIAVPVDRSAARRCSDGGPGEAQ